MVRATFAVLAVVALLAAAATARAQDGYCQAPPGVAAVDQYCENVPAAGGPRTPPGPKLGRTIPARVRRALTREGAAGLSVLQLVAQPGQRVRASSHARSAHARSAHARSAHAQAVHAEVGREPSGGPLAAVRHSVSEGVDLDLLLVALLVLLAIVLGMLAARRRRRTAT